MCTVVVEGWEWGGPGAGGPEVRGTRCRGAWEGPVCDGGPVGRPGYEGTWIGVGRLRRGEGLGVPIWGSWEGPGRGPRCGQCRYGKVWLKVGTGTHLLHFKQSVVNRVSYIWPSTLPSHQTLNRCSTIGESCLRKSFHWTLSYGDFFKNFFTPYWKFFCKELVIDDWLPKI